jgi:hypothetical protein
MIKRLLCLGIRPRPRKDALTDPIPQSDYRRQAGTALMLRPAREFAAAVPN